MAAFNDRKDSRRLALAWLMLTFYWSLHREWHVRVIILNSFAVLRPPFVPKTESRKQKLVRKFLTNGFLEINVRKKERMYGLFYKMSKLRNLFNLSLYYDSKRFYFFSPFFCFPVLWKTRLFTSLAEYLRDRSIFLIEKITFHPRETKLFTLHSPFGISSASQWRAMKWGCFLPEPTLSTHPSLPYRLLANDLSRGSYDGAAIETELRTLPLAIHVTSLSSPS